MTLEFRIEKKIARLHDPRANFKLTEVESEIRYEPLTGQSGRICHFALSKLPIPDLSPLVEMSRPVCPFCPERVETVTPRFPEEVLKSGRMRHGGALLVPNLFPYDDLSTVAVLCPEHYFAMDAVPEQAVRDGLTLARNFFAATGEQVAGGQGYGLVSWNYLPPSGGTQIHPHMQVVLTTNPGNGVVRELDAGAAYRERTGRTYGVDLLEQEQRRGERWIGSEGNVAWLAPFVPLGLLGDAQAVFAGRASMADLSDSDIADFARGLVRILRGFTQRGLWSFNLAFLPARFNDDDAAPSHTLTARVLPRMYINPALHASDASSLRMLLDEPASMVYPEETAELLRSALRAG